MCLKICKSGKGNNHYLYYSNDINKRMLDNNFINNENYDDNLDKVIYDIKYEPDQLIELRKIYDMNGKSINNKDYVKMQEKCYIDNGLLNSDEYYIDDIKYDNEPFYILRDYQIDAIEKLKNNFNTNIGALFLPCGMGKTLIVSNYLKHMSYKIVFIFSPFKQHAEQNLERVSRFLPEYKKILFDSDKLYEDNYTIITTNINKIISSLDRKTIISTTYNSAINIISQLFKNTYGKGYINKIKKNINNNEDNDSNDYNKDIEYEDNFIYNNLCDINNIFLYVDEAHNILNMDLLIDVIKNFKKVIINTATPPMELNDKLSYSVLYNYKLCDAISNGYICDYRLYIPLLTNTPDNKSKTIDIIDDIPDMFKKTEKNLVYKGMYLFNFLYKTNSKRTIVYMSSIEECNKFKIIIKDLSKYHFGLSINSKLITKQTNKKERKENLNWFQKNDDEVKIIISIKILNEAIDIPCCDSIFITNNSNDSNDITLVQRICRANRLDKNNRNKISNILLWVDEYKVLHNILFYLKNNDINLSKKLKIINGNFDKNDNPTIINHIKNEMNHINDYSKKYVVLLEDIWEENRKLLFEFCQINKRVICYDEIYKNKKLGIWLYNNMKEMWDLYKKHNIILEKQDRFQKLIENEIIQKKVVKWIEDRIKNKDIIKLSENDKKQKLINYFIEHKKPPSSSKKLKLEYINTYGFNIGEYWGNIIENIDYCLKNNNYEKIEYYKTLNTDIAIEIEKYLDKKDKNKNKTKYSEEEQIDIIIRYYNENNKTLPLTYNCSEKNPQRDKYIKLKQMIIEKYDIYVGEYFGHHKQKIKKELYKNNGKSLLMDKYIAKCADFEKIFKEYYCDVYEELNKK